MTRKQLLRKLEARIGSRKLVWFGTRGEDCRPLLDLPQFSEVFSLIAPFESVAMHVDECLEDLSRTRVDLDTYDLDQDASEPAKELRRRLFRSLSEPTVLVPYRPLAFLSSVQYPRAEYVEYLGLFHERQAPFEHKPWVESELRRIGVAAVPWRYYTDEDRQRVAELIESAGPIVLRANRSDGGVGLAIVETPNQLAEVWRPQPDGFLGVAPLLRPHIPLNVSACVFADGTVTLHPPSLQLLGIPSCTNRPFGYCGNDFGAAKQLDSSVLRDLEQMTRTTGRWLAEKGYLGAFGIDAMVHEGKVLLAEVNPRFQGSSALSAQIDTRLDRPDVFLSHIGAFLGFTAPNTESLGTVVEAQPACSQIICHNRSGRSLWRSKGSGPTAKFVVGLMPSSGLELCPEAALFRASFDDSVTHDGFGLAETYSRFVADFAQDCFQATGQIQWRTSENDAARQSSEQDAPIGREPAEDPASHYAWPLHSVPGSGGL